MLEALAAKLTPYLPGFVGAGLAAMLSHRNKRPMECFISFGTGAALATFLTGPVLHFLSWNPDVYGGGVGFCLGFFGMTMAEAIMRLIRSFKLEDIPFLKGGGK